MQKSSSETRATFEYCSFLIHIKEREKEREEEREKEMEERGKRIEKKIMKKDEARREDK